MHRYNFKKNPSKLHTSIASTFYLKSVENENKYLHILYLELFLFKSRFFGFRFDFVFAFLRRQTF